MFGMLLCTLAFFFITFATFNAFTDQLMSRFFLDSELPYV